MKGRPDKRRIVFMNDLSEVSEIYEEEKEVDCNQIVEECKFTASKHAPKAKSAPSSKVRLNL